MAQFDESKIISALHPEKAEVGKKYWFSDNLSALKSLIIVNDTDITGKLVEIVDGCYPFRLNKGGTWQFLYPYEEPPKKRMTNIQLMEWLAKGNGIFKYKDYESCFGCITRVDEASLNEELDEDIIIRPFGSKEWVEPTSIIYDRDCCGMNIVTKED